MHCSRRLLEAEGPLPEPVWPPPLTGLLEVCVFLIDWTLGDRAHLSVLWLSPCQDVLTLGLPGSWLWGHPVP